MKTLDEYSKSQAEILVGYYTTDLLSFKAPKVWTENLGWKPESKDTCYKDVLEESVFDAKKSRLSETHSRTIQNPELQRSLRIELNESQMFEERLKAALGNRNETNANPALEVTSIGRRSLERQNQSMMDISVIPPAQPHKVEYFYEPVISSLSPSLGRLASSRSALMRRKSLSALKVLSSTPSLESLGVAPSPLDSSKKRKALDEKETRPLARSSSDRLAKLRRNIEEDLNSSYDFEKRLQNAMTE